MKDKQVYIIAEAGVNHNGSLKLALELIDKAAEAGADSVKFQTFRTENVVSKNAPKAEYQKENTGTSETQFEMIKKLELNEEEHLKLLAHCRTRNIQFLSTPFDLPSIDLLVDVLKVPRLKLPSGEITNAPYLLKAARSGKPVILSTGMSSMEDIENALGVIAFGYVNDGAAPSLAGFRAALQSAAGQQKLREKVILLHCTTEYPAPFEEVNLNAMAAMRKRFGLPVGYSDHTVGIAVSVAAVALGATVIEKHFTLDRNLPGPDHKASLEPGELKNLVRSIREVEVSLGQELKTPAPSELKNRVIARKSLVAATAIRKGEKFTETNLTTKRPGDGIAPFRYWEYLGKTADRDFDEDEKIK